MSQSLRNLLRAGNRIISFSEFLEPEKSQSLRNLLRAGNIIKLQIVIFRHKVSIPS